MAIALTGAVIVDDRSILISYRKKCGSCGYIEGGSTVGCPPSLGTTAVSSFNCQKCRAYNETRIQG